MSLISFLRQHGRSMPSLMTPRQQSHHLPELVVVPRSRMLLISFFGDRRFSRRVNFPDELEARIRARGIDPASPGIAEYVEVLRQVGVPHRCMVPGTTKRSPCGLLSKDSAKINAIEGFETQKE